MLAVRRGEPRVLGMVLMRARDIDGLDLRIGAKRGDRLIGRAAEIFREACRASGRGSAAATRATRGSCCSVGSMRRRHGRGRRRPSRMRRDAVDATVVLRLARRAAFRLDILRYLR